MTKFPSEQTILVTGATGFLAGHIINIFLEEGYCVRGTVRTQSSAQILERRHPQHADKLSTIIVKDLAHENAFTEAVSGVDGVIHVASPFTMSVEDNERDLLLPAIRGTTGLLDAVATHAPQVKRVVLTSSHAALASPTKPLEGGYTLTEQDWNSTTYEEAKVGSGVVAYCASKALAERSAWDFMEQRQPAFNLTVLNPPMIFGPPIIPTFDIRRLSSSIADIYRLMNGTLDKIPETHVPFMVDVRDIARAHLQAYTVPAAGNERCIVYGHEYSYQDICAIIREELPQVTSKVPIETSREVAAPRERLSNELSVKLLGMEYRSLRETIEDTAKVLLQAEGSAVEAR